MKGIHGGDIYRNQVELDFSVNSNPFGMPQGVKAALQRAAERCEVYPDMESEALKQALSDKLAVAQEMIIFGNGASELFLAIVHAIRPRRILIPVPSFYGYEHAAGAVDAELIYYQLPLEKELDTVSEAGLLEALEEDVDMLMLANPNNPTGALWNPGQIKRLLDRCRERDIYVVLDECFIEFCAEPEQIEREYAVKEELAGHDKVVLVRAFTKLYAIPGARLGYLLCTDAVLRERIRRQLPEWNVSVPAQAAGEACIQEEAYVRQTVSEIRKERQFLEQELTRMGMQVYSGAANFILFYSSIPSFYERLLERGILIRDCQNFRGLSKGYYRIAVRTRAENERLLQEIRRIAICTCDSKLAGNGEAWL